MPAFEMNWRNALFASHPVDPATVQPHLPPTLDVETFEGDAYLSIVALVIENIRPKGLPAAVGVTTPELNLRTYVTCEEPRSSNKISEDSHSSNREEPHSSGRSSGSTASEQEGGGGTPGVYFFSLDADNLLGTVGGRLFNNLPYYYADIEYDPGTPTRFESRRHTPGTRAVEFEATYGPDGDSYQPGPGTVEHFHTERYRYFTEAQDGTIRYATLDHEPWTLRPGTWEVTKNTLFEANGFEHPDSDPVVSYSRGLAVEASASQRWDR